MPEKRCRICWDYTNWTLSWVDIFTKQNVHLLRQIHSITGVQLTNLNEQPRHMCNTCLIDLDTAIKFRQRCILSQKQIKVEDDPGEVFCEAIDINHSMVENLEDLIEEVHEEDYEHAEEDSDSQIEYYFTKTEEIAGNNIELFDKESEIVAFQKQSELLDHVRKPLEYIEKTTNSRLGKSKAKSIGHFVCDICGNSFYNTSNFREHKLRHAGIKNFMCKFCRKRFITRREMVRHTRVHTGERPYTCKYCSSTFADLGILQQHERRHTNSRPYGCAMCDKSFFSSSCLSKHRLSHRVLPRIHHCTVCELWFHRFDHLTTHLKTSNHKRKERAEKKTNSINITT